MIYHATVIQTSDKTSWIIESGWKHSWTPGVMMHELGSEAPMAYRSVETLPIIWNSPPLPSFFAKSYINHIRIFPWSPFVNLFLSCAVIIGAPAWQRLQHDRYGETCQQVGFPSDDRQWSSGRGLWPVWQDCMKYRQFSWAITPWLEPIYLCACLLSAGR